MSAFHSTLGHLVDPTHFTQPIDLRSFHKDEVLSLLESMIRIRETENKIADLANQGHAKCPCHLSIGQEAIAVGVCASLTADDGVFSTHRCHSHYLAKGGTPYELIAEVLGKKDGCSEGRGGSMHLIGTPFGFLGSVPIVGGTISLAVGTAFAHAYQKKNHIAVCFFGDGACEEGVFHESLNFASLMQLPVLFVCENNLYSAHMDISERQPSDSMARFATAHSVESTLLDGNDVISILKHSLDIIESMRRHPKPHFLECITYRWKGHVGPKDDFGVGSRRTEEDVVQWKKRDPIERLATSLISSHFLTKEDYVQRIKHIQNEIEKDTQQALKAPYPDHSTLLNHLYEESERRKS